MVATNRKQLHHRTVNNGHDDTPNSVLPTTRTPSSSLSERSGRSRKPLNAFGGFVGGNKGLLSRQSILILLFGTLIGYSVLPILLIESGPFSGTVTQKSFLFGDNPTTRDPRHLTGDDIMSRLMENKKLLSTQSLPTDRTPMTMETAVLSDQHRKKILVTGGAGFVGSHLVDKLMMEGHEVTVVDNFFTGQKKNVAHWMHHPNFRYVGKFLSISSLISFFRRLSYSTWSLCTDNFKFQVDL